MGYSLLRKESEGSLCGTPLGKFGFGPWNQGESFWGTIKMKNQGYWVFIIVVTLLLVSWSLVTFWQRFLENLMYQTLGFNSESTTSALLAALASTGVFFLLVWGIKFSGLIPNLDFLIYDYNDESSIGGPLGTMDRFRARTIGKKVSPRGALPTILGY